ncbi:MAG: HIT domain-containing protein [Nanoarchaeota archaeon]
MLSKQQAEFVRTKLLSQIDNLPAAQQEEVREQINSMSDKELEEFLVKNNLVKPGSDASSSCTFCLLVQGSIPSNKISENEEAIAILEINPISKGHVIIIPKEHLEAKHLKKPLFEFSKKLSSHIKEKLNAKNIEIITSELFGHGIINLIPIYDNEKIDLDGKRYKASESELEKLKSLLEYKNEEKETKEKTSKTKKSSQVKKTKKSEEKEEDVEEEEMERNIKAIKKEKEELKLPKAPRRIP